MITLKINKHRDLKPGDVVHLRIASIEQASPGRWTLYADDITPLPGAEHAGYGCGYCGIIEEAKEDGALPEGWVEIKYQEGSSFRCPDCAGFPTCRVCGCTEASACEGGCYWVEEDLCSACEGKEEKEKARK